MNNLMQGNKDAFSLVEVLIGIAIMAIVLGLAFVNITNFKAKEDFTQDAESVEESLRFAQNKARLGEGGVDWGIRFSNDAGGGYYEVFQGSSYSASQVLVRRNLSDSSRFTNPAAGATKTILFSAISGLPSTGNSVVIRKEPYDNTAYVISVSNLGKISKNLETGLIGMWTFDEGTGTVANDASGQANAGTLTNFSFSGSSNWVSLGRVGGALSFDGTNDYVRMAVAPFNPSQITFGGWFNIPNISASQKALISKTEGSGYSLYLNHGSFPNQVSGWVRVGAAYYNPKFASSLLTANSWQFVYVTYDGSAAKIYLNGELEDTISASGSITTSNEPLTIGAEPGGGGTSFSAYLNGAIDDVRIYNRALSDTEIKNLYEEY